MRKKTIEIIFHELCDKRNSIYGKSKKKIESVILIDDFQFLLCLSAPYNSPTQCDTKCFKHICVFDTTVVVLKLISIFSARIIPCLISHLSRSTRLMFPHSRCFYFLAGKWAHNKISPQRQDFLGQVSGPTEKLSILCYL